MNNRYIWTALLTMSCFACDPGEEPLAENSAALNTAPDLMVTSLLRLQEYGTYQATICNAGTADAPGSFTLRFDDPADGRPAHEEMITGLFAAECRSLNLPCGITGDGTCHGETTIQATADVYAQLAELDESNNQLQQAFGTTRNLTVETLIRDQFSGYYRVTVCNLGIGDVTSPFTLRFTDLTVMHAPYESSISSLSSGECQVHVAPCGFAGDGSCHGTNALRVEVDVGSQIAETNELDNSVEQVFHTTRDVAVTAVTRSQYYQVYFATICNIGTGDVIPPFTVRFEEAIATGRPPADTVVGYLYEGECQYLVAPCGIAGDGTCTGSDSVRVTSDVHGELEETDEGNNARSTSFGTTIELAVTSLIRDQAYEVYRATFCNSGSGDIFQPFVVRLQDPTRPTPPADHAVSYLYSGECRELVVPCGIAGDGTCAGEATVRATVDFFGDIAETDETNNQRQTSFGATRDVVVTSVIRQQFGYYAATVCNLGYGHVYLPFTVRFEDPTQPWIRPHDARVFSLYSGECQSLVAPCGFAGDGTCAGPATVRVTADVHQQIAELDESNNIREQVDFITGTDLSVTAIARDVPNYRFVATVCNSGTEDIGSSFVVRAEDTAYPLWGQDYLVGGMPAGACQDLSFTCALSPDCFGVISLHVTVDVYGDIGEAAEGNNRLEKTFPATRDLEVSSIIRDRENYFYRVTLCNSGITDVIQPFTVRLEDLAQPGAPVETQLWGAPPGVCFEINFPCFIGSTDTCFTTVNMRATVDAYGEVAETNESNNQLDAGFSSVRDLSVSSLIRDQSSFQYRAMVCNSGLGDIYEMFNIRFEDAAAPGNFQDVPFFGLPTGACAEVQMGCHIAGDGRCVGPSTVRVTADVPDAIIESDESNNQVTAIFDAQQDLILTSIVRDPASLRYRATICNSGAGDILEGFTVRFEDAAMPALPYDTQIFGVPPGACLELNAPCWVAGDGSCLGAAAVRVTADAFDDIIEANETDNVLERSFSTQRDVSIASIVRDLSMQRYRASLCNSGQGEINAPIEVRFEDPMRPWIPPQNHTFWGLPPAACVELNQACIFGDGTCAGATSVRVTADYPNQIAEVDETNNQREMMFASVYDLTISNVVRTTAPLGYAVTVCNAGLGDIDQTFDISLATIGSAQPPVVFSGFGGIPVGLCADVHFSCAGIGDGSCDDYLNVRATADSAFVVGEGDETNNQLTVTLGTPVQTPWASNQNGTLSTNVSWHYAMGYHFTPQVNGEIIGLGGYFSGTKSVRLFNRTTGALLTQVNVTSSNAWSYVNFPAIPVTAGTSYTVAVYLAGSGGSYRSPIAALPRTYGDIRIEGSTFVSTGSSPNARPTNNVPGTMYGQADIRFRRTSAPPVPPAGMATFDPARGAPACNTAQNRCDSDTLVDGRAALGPEQHAPNTIDVCADGTGGGYHSDESLDRLVIHVPAGGNLRAGVTARIEATVWGWSNGTSDFLDLYYAPNAGSVSWTYLTTIRGLQGGSHVLAHDFVLSAAPGGFSAIRGQWRYSGSMSNPGACLAGSYNDRDDLVFAVAP